MQSITACLSFSCGSRPTGLGNAPSRRSNYRRSNTTKAPRKRTFIQNMSKYNPGELCAASGGLLRTAGLSEANGSMAPWELCQGGDSGNSAGSGGKGKGPGARPTAAVASGDDAHHGGREVPPRPPHSPRQSLLRTAIMASTVAGVAYLGLPSSPSVAHSAQPAAAGVLGRNQGVNATQGTAKPAGGGKGGVRAVGARLVYGIAVELSAKERRMLQQQCSQMQFRETLRSDRVCL
ncbi:hypothetical protein QJQ45_016436 [Haematococcus lacustris]|nr:hypothetical protein QJQ45_016436 [Haematococcus lacustris]